MSVHRRYHALYALVLIAAFHVVGCTHDKVAARSDNESSAATQANPVTAASNKNTPTEPAATTQTTPEVSSPAKPAAPIPAEPVVTTPSDMKTNAELKLKPGQSGAVDASTKLHYVRMVNDSRCPADAQCIWAGEVTVELMLDSGKEKQTFTLKDDEKAASILGYTIELISIDQNHLINIRVQKIKPQGR